MLGFKQCGTNAHGSELFNTKSCERTEYMSQRDQSNPRTKLNKTDARQGRVVGEGRVAKILLTSLAALVVLGVLLFLIF